MVRSMVVSFYLHMVGRKVVVIPYLDQPVHTLGRVVYSMVVNLETHQSGPIQPGIPVSSTMEHSMVVFGIMEYLDMEHLTEVVH